MDKLDLIVLSKKVLHDLNCVGINYSVIDKHVGMSRSAIQKIARLSRVPHGSNLIKLIEYYKKIFLQCNYVDV